MVKIAGSVKDNIMSLFKISTSKNDSKQAHFNNVYGGLKKPRKPKNNNNNQKTKSNNKNTEDRITRVSNNLFEQEQHYYKPI